VRYEPEIEMKFDIHDIPKLLPATPTTADRSDSRATLLSLLRAFGLGALFSGVGLAASIGAVVAVGPWWASRGEVSLEETVIAANGPAAELPSVSAAPPDPGRDAAGERISPLQ